MGDVLKFKPKKSQLNYDIAKLVEPLLKERAELLDLAILHKKSFNEVGIDTKNKIRLNEQRILKLWPGFSQFMQ